MTSVDLQTLFSDFAPVRSAFVVLEQGTGASKGVGYVSFSLKEDAQAALEKISKDGIQIAGRNLRVQYANSKSKGTTKQQEKDRPRPRVPHQPPQDPLAIRTLVVSGLPASINTKALWKKFRKYGAEKVDWPAEGDDPTQAYVFFASPAAALESVDKLHGHVFKGALLSVALKKRIDTLSKTSSKIKTKTKIPSRANRLIVRNIPFNITEQDLRAIFLPYGPIHSIVIPSFKASDGSQKELRKGFAFVWMLSKKDAEAALTGCNGMVVRPGIAENIRLDKQIKKKQRRLDKKNEASAVEQEDDNQAVLSSNKAERTIAVDWALSKDRWEEEKTKFLHEDENQSSEQDSPGSDSEMDEAEESMEDGSIETGSSNEGSEASDSDSDRSSLPDQERKKPQLPDTDVGTTLFVRNIPFEATEEELRTLFRSFGPLRYARITVDSSTRRSRGTGFVCFWSKGDADEVIAQSELLKTETSGSSSVQPRNPFTLPSILTPDPSSELARSLVLHGRTLDVVRAVTRDIAGKLKEEGEKQRQKADKRNMYLLNEGVILANNPAAQSLPQADLERRAASFNSRKALLKSNPSLYISKTRLSIRQIPTFVTDRMLKRLATHGVAAFLDEVASGSRSPLTQNETEDGLQPTKDTARVVVKQVKIVRQQDRVDSVTGKGRSKGYGFVEMERHSHALQVLRWANNNPTVGHLFEAWWKDELSSLLKIEEARKPQDEARVKRIRDEISNGVPKKSRGTLIIEFSVENIQVVQRRKALQKEQAETSTTQKKRATAAEETELPVAKRQKMISEQPPKLGSEIGSLIGRKRRQKRGAKH